MSDVTEIPKLEREPDDTLPESAAEGSPRRRRRRDPDPAEPVEVVEPRPASESVTEAQLVRAFYWLYRGWCRVIGAQVDAHQSDFQDLGRAWLELARKVPGMRWIVAAAGPVFTLTDLVDRLAQAWEVRTRFRAQLRIRNWRQRSQDGSEAASDVDVHVVDGGTRAP